MVGVAGQAEGAGGKFVIVGAPRRLSTSYIVTDASKALKLGPRTRSLGGDRNLSKENPWKSCENEICWFQRSGFKP